MKRCPECNSDWEHGAVQVECLRCRQQMAEVLPSVFGHLAAERVPEVVRFFERAPTEALVTVEFGDGRKARGFITRWEPTGKVNEIEVCIQVRSFEEPE